MLITAQRYIFLISDVDFSLWLISQCAQESFAVFEFGFIYGFSVSLCCQLTGYEKLVDSYSFTVWYYCHCTG